MILDIASTKFFKQLWGLLANRFAFGCFIITTVGQIIEASSTIWLVLMMKQITEGEPFLFNFFLYLVTLAFPYIPGCIAYIIKMTWKQETQRSFIHAFVKSNRNKLSEWSSKDKREEKLSILTAEGPNALNELIDYLYDLYSYVISVFLNIFALSIVVEPLFAITYGVSVLAVIFTMKAKRRIQNLLTQKALMARVDLYQSLLAAWDNVLLGNHYNFKLWQERTSQRIDRCLKKNVDLESFDQILAINISLITSIPSLILVIYYVYLNIGNTTELVALMVTLPILFCILSYTYQTLSLVFRWTMHRSKLQSICKAIQPTNECPTVLQKKIQWDKINIYEDHLSHKGPQPISSYEDLLQYTSKSGRVTLRGENGSGKSTLLMLIKNSLSDRAFFLPTQSQLSFLSQGNKYSTGESLRNRLLEILNRVDVDVLLLDEWDANLDIENQKHLSLLINELSKKKCVIEVRHR